VKLCVATSSESRSASGRTCCRSGWSTFERLRNALFHLARAQARLRPEFEQLARTLLRHLCSRRPATAATAKAAGAREAPRAAELLLRFFVVRVVGPGAPEIELPRRPRRARDARARPSPGAIAPRACASEELIERLAPATLVEADVFEES